MYKHNKRLTPLARNLRKNMTREEKHLWYDFLKHREERWLKQKIVDNYILDFYCAVYNLAIELDGSQHYEEENERKDAIRTERINEYGIDVIRIPNVWINKYFVEVCDYIIDEVNKRDSKRM